MKKTIIFTYEWLNEANPLKPIPAHHETQLMGFAEWRIPKERRGRTTSGKLKHTCKDALIETHYTGMWEVKYKY